MSEWWVVVDGQNRIVQREKYESGADAERDAETCDQYFPRLAPHRAVLVTEKGSESHDTWKAAYNLITEMRANEWTLADVERAFREKVDGNYLDVPCRDCETILRARFEKEKSDGK